MKQQTKINLLITGFLLAMMLAQGIIILSSKPKPIDQLELCDCRTFNRENL